MGQMMSEIADEEDGNNNHLTTAAVVGPLAEVTLFHKYELGKLLGHGAFAKVYHARDLRTGHSVAIKSINKQRILKGNLAPLVHREISIMCGLRHPHIVRLHEVLATKTRIFSVMEFAKGGEVFSKIAMGGRFTEHLSRKYFQQLISAVAYCHSRGVFHRDLKPENLLLDENWDLKVTDFGLSALTDQLRQDGMLHTFCGTPAYVAPEILAKKGYDGAKADLWSCGVILFVMNSGYLPFNDTNLMNMYRKIYRGEFRCPKWTPPELKRFLGRILDPNPDTRITVDEIMEDPWFRKGYREVRLPVEREFEFKKDYDDNGARCLNAFDLIAYSSGSDLSGLLGRVGAASRCEIFVSEESAERIIERIVAVAAVVDGEDLIRVVEKGRGVRLQGRKSNTVVMVEVKRLTAELAVVEVRRSGFGADELWEEKLKPKLGHLLHYSGCR